MTNDEFKAWLLLAGFRLYRKYCFVKNHEGWYVTVTFLYGQIEVGTLTGTSNFYIPGRAKRYIQEVLEIIGDQP